MKLLVFLTDTLQRLEEKGEIKSRYYNPGNLFTEVHFVSPARKDLGASQLQSLVGDARMVVHALGASYGMLSRPPFRRLSAVMRAVSPDVIRAYDPGLRGSLAVLWGQRLGVPSVISVHADLDDQRRHEQRPLHYLRKLLERYALQRVDVVVCVSRHVESYVKRYRHRPATVIYNRVDTARFAPPPPTMPPGRLRILTVGRLVRQKFQACLIRALPSLDAHLTIIGDGPLREPLGRLASRLGVEDRVEFIRSVPHADIHRCYRDADLFAMATHYEGFCIPVLEAMASGLPVVVSDIGPLPELIEDAGVLVENTPEAFTRALQRLISDHAMRLRLGERARQRALAMDGARMEAQEQSVYEALMRARPIEEGVALHG